MVTWRGIGYNNIDSAPETRCRCILKMDKDIVQTTNIKLRSVGEFMTRQGWLYIDKQQTCTRRLNSSENYSGTRRGIN